MDKKVIEIKNLFKSYHIGHVEVPALKNINLAVIKNQYVVIKGPSGSGKSTLMHIVGCLDRADRGSYYFDGHLVEELSDLELAEIRGGKIGFIFQSFNLIPRLSILKNVELPLFYLGIPASERSSLARNSLARVGLEHRLTHSPAELSGGEKQRLAIARAIITQPDIIIADEPTCSLDVTIQAQILRLMQNLRKEIDTTIMFITSDLGIVAEMADKVAMMYAGQIIETCDVFTTFENPAHPYTKGIIGSIMAMKAGGRLNIIPGDPPNLLDLPSGCKFHPRCDYCQDICTKEVPEFRDLEGDGSHWIRCHFPLKTSAEKSANSREG